MIRTQITSVYIRREINKETLELSNFALVSVTALQINPSVPRDLSGVLLEMNASEFSLIFCDTSDENSFTIALQLAKAHKPQKEDAVLILTVPNSPIGADLYSVLEENFDHIIKISESDLSLSLPAQMIVSACQPGFIDIDVLDIIHLFKQYRYSLLDAAGCVSSCHIKEFLCAWTHINKKHCDTISFSPQAVLLNLLINVESGDLQAVESVMNAFEKSFVCENCEIVPFGKFVSQEAFLEISMLLMSKERW